MNQVNIRFVYVDTVSTTIAAADTEYSVEKTMPISPLRIIQIYPELYDASGVVIPTVEARGKVRVSIQTATSPIRNFTNVPTSVFAFEKMCESELWRGWRFRSREVVTFTFTVTQITSQPGLPVDCRLHLMGYLEEQGDSNDVTVTL